MSIVSLTNVEKSFADRRLFTTVSFALDRHDHAVLVGRNGSGKTTLLRLVAGTEPASSGTIARARGKRVWLHEQTPELNRDQPISDYLLTAFGDAVRLESEIRSVEQTLSSLNEQSPELHDVMLAYQQLQRRFEAAGGYRYRGELTAVLEGLGFPETLLERRLLSLSGGELTRVTLARALLAAHDRRLLERVGSRVLSLEHEHVETMGCDFTTYVREREAGQAVVARRYEQDQQKLEQLQRFYDRFHAKKLKAKQAQAKLTQMERIKSQMKAPLRAERGLRLNLPQPAPSARVVLELKAPRLTIGGADQAGGARTLIRDLDAVIERGEKVALLGPNGAGKTTLAETIVGLRALADGAVHIGHNVRLAYFSQQGRELDEALTMLQCVLPLVGHDEEQARRLLGRFLFSADDVVKPVAKLSGGERSRLRLLTLLVGKANFLVLDEPTNHLDVTSVEALAEALREYTGTMLLITHDRHLIHTVAARVLEIHDQQLLNHLSVERYWEARAARGGHLGASTEAAADAPAASRGVRDEAAAAKARPDPELERRRRARLRGVEAEMLKAEKRLGDIDHELAQPQTYQDRPRAAALVDERTATETRLEKLYGQWEELLGES